MKSKAKRWRMYMWFFKLIPLCCRLLDHVAMISQVSAPQQSLQKREWTNHTTEESKLSRNSSKYVKLLNKFKCTSTGTKAATRLFCSSLHTMGGPSFFGHGAWGGRVGYCYTNYVVTFAEQPNDGGGRGYRLQGCRTGASSSSSGATLPPTDVRLCVPSV
jgi:hypothetical protein